MIRVLDLSFGSVEENLAFDEELLDSRGEPLRFWECPHHIVVMGRSTQAKHEVRMEICRSLGVTPNAVPPQAERCYSPAHRLPLGVS